MEGKFFLCTLILLVWTASPVSRLVKAMERQAEATEELLSIAKKGR